MKKVKQKMKNGFECALDLSVDDQNLAGEMAQFHDANAFPSKFPMTFYRLQRRMECRHEIMKKITQSLFDKYMWGINKLVESDFNPKTKRMRFNFPKEDLKEYEKLLSTTGLGEVKPEDFYEMIRKTFSEFYGLKNCFFTKIVDDRLNFEFIF
jgi:hypothetical protein